MSISVTRSLEGRGILLTGCTGFVGKALYEKIIRDIPNIGTVFILIRGKAEDRFWAEIHGSAIMTRLRQQYNNDAALDSFVKSKVIAIKGDVQRADLGLSKKDHQLLKERVNVVVHCAATVDFKERLDIAAKQNVLGTLNIFELARGFARLESFIHVSTAYVNSDREGFHREQLPPLNCDAEEMVELILQMNPNDFERQTATMIGDYPNTYTFTKALAETILVKKWKRALVHRQTYHHRLLRF